MRSAAGVLITLAMGLGLSLGGCATRNRIHPEELPKEPIAFTWWSAEDTRRRAEILEEHTNPRRNREGVADLAQVGALFRDNGGEEADELAGRLSKFPGKLVLLYPETGEIEPVPAAPRSSRALAWSKDHRKLLFSNALTTGLNQIYEYDLDSQEVRPVTHGKRRHMLADYGPDAQLVYSQVSVREGKFQGAIYRTAPGGAYGKPIVDEVPSRALRWSPDGEVLVYVREAALVGPTQANRSRTATIVSRRLAEPKEARVLTRGRDPVISRDGEWIVFTAYRRKGWRLQRMRSDGSARSQLGEGLRDEVAPAISPDGNYVVYVGSEASLDRLYIRRFDGSGDRQLVPSAGAAWPVW